MSIERRSPFGIERYKKCLMPPPMGGQAFDKREGSLGWGAPMSEVIGGGKSRGEPVS